MTASGDRPRRYHADRWRQKQLLLPQQDLYNIAVGLTNSFHFLDIALKSVRLLFNGFTFDNGFKPSRLGETQNPVKPDAGHRWRFLRQHGFHDVGDVEVISIRRVVGINRTHEKMGKLFRETRRVCLGF